MSKPKNDVSQRPPPCPSSEPARAARRQAEKLDAERRREIAQRAALARWGDGLPVATHDGSLKIGDRLIECAVLSDETRVDQSGAAS